MKAENQTKVAFEKFSALKDGGALSAIDLQKENKNLAKNTFEELTSKGKLVWFDLEGEAQFVSKDQINKMFDTENMELIVIDGKLGPVLYQTGWFYPKVRGVIEYSYTLEGKTYKKLYKKIRTLFRQGHSVTFNKDIDQCLEKVISQRRKGQPEGSSRYKNENLVNGLKESFAKGSAFSIEVWDSSGKLVGGSIGNRDGNLFSPDTVFYDHIDFAKIAVVALIDRLKKSGIDVVDAGMVTPFTAALKGQYVTTEYFEQLRKTIPADVEVDLNTPWKPEMND